MTPQDRAGDVLSAAVWLRARPDIDGGRIGVIGFSHGGATAAWVTQSRYQRLFPGLLKASVDYYGSCFSPETQGTVPLLALAGEDDTWGFPAQTCGAFGGKLRPDQGFEVHTYPGVVHAFDNEETPDRVVKDGHPLQYDKPAAEDSYARPIIPAMPRAAAGRGPAALPEWRRARAVARTAGHDATRPAAVLRAFSSDNRAADRGTSDE